MSKEMSLEIKAVLVLRDSLEKAVIELNELVQEQIPVEFKEKPCKSAIPDFDPADLMKHDWKGKKLGQGEYEQGSLYFGWDFREHFKNATIKVLEDGNVLTIGESEFILLDRIVQTKKKVKGA